MDEIFKLLLFCVIFTVAIFVSWKLVVWAKKRKKGAFLFAMFLPMIAVQAVPPPTYERVEEAKEEKKENEDDSGDPPNKDTESESGSEKLKIDDE